MAPRGLVPRPLSLLSPQGEVAGLAARARIPAGIGSQMKSSDHSPGSKVWEEAVERFGKAVALDAGGCSLAFEDLDRRSRLVAEALCAKPEWRPGLRIGVETSRVDFFVEALGVWIAGGVLVPYCAAHLEADARLAGLVNALVGNQSKTDSGVSRSWFDDCATWLQ
jgi:acyl-CoA synthetase (AMP-forming)/AMP-acid ligase II